MSTYMIQFNVWREEQEGPFTRHIVLKADNDSELSYKITKIVEYALDTLGEEWEITDTNNIHEVDDLFKNDSLSFFHRKWNVFENSN